MPAAALSLGRIAPENAMRWVLAVLGFVLFCWAYPAYAAEVDLQVILAADVSRSIDEGEFELQRKGYAAALSDPRVLQAIRGGDQRTLAGCLFALAGGGEEAGG